MKKIWIIIIIILLVFLMICNLNITKKQEEYEIQETNNINEESNTGGKQVVYSELTPELSEGKAMFVNNVIEKDNSYVLQGILFEHYTMSQLEVDSILDAGTVVLDGKIYIIKEHSDEYDNFENTVYDLFEDGAEYPLYYIIKENDEYVLKRGAQIDYCFKSTGKFVTITIEKSTSFVENIGIADEPISTVEKEFSNYIPGELRDNDTFPIPSYTFEFTDGKCTFVRAENGI